MKRRRSETEKIEKSAKKKREMVRARAGSGVGGRQRKEGSWKIEKKQAQEIGREVGDGEDRRKGREGNAGKDWSGMAGTR